jgi:CRISPR-associated protein Csd1
MILQALNSLYERTPSMARYGFAPMGISWIIALTLDGKIAQIRDFRERGERSPKPFPQDLVVPTVGKRTSGDKAIFLCDKSDYVLGRNVTGETTRKGREKLVKRFEGFRDLHVAAKVEVKHPHFAALVAFLEQWKPFASDAVSSLEALSGEKLSALSGGNYAFMIAGQPNSFLHDLPEAVDYWASTLDKPDAASEGVCLITGRRSQIVRLHPAIKGISDEPGKPVEKGIVVINKDKTAFTSHGKEQSFNAPVSGRAAFSYSTALNYLLENRRITIGDASTVYWTEQASDAEDLLPFLIEPAKQPEDESVKQRLEEVLGKLAQGILSSDDLGDANTPFYVLGLSPNASRISVRFWESSKLGSLAANLQAHYRDLKSVRQWDETNSNKPEALVLGIRTLLLQTVPPKDGKPDSGKISPLLAGALVRSIISGSDYPDALFIGALKRIHAEREVSYPRASIIKAFLNRNHQRTHKPMLDESNNHHAYRLGRLFAVLEKIQEEGHRHQTGSKDIPRTIRDTYFGSASRTPASVFSRLDQLGNIYRRHLPHGRKTFFDKLIQDIKWGQAAPKPVLHARDQGEFVLGYYHQRKALFPSKITTDKTATIP